MTRILFVDPCGYKPYTANTLRTEALGGSEASMIRVARGLAAAGCDVSLYQAVDDQRETEVVDGIRHVGLDSLFPKPQVVVHFRTCREMVVWEGIYPKARHIMWTQDVLTPDVAHECEGKEIVCLTDWHRQQFLGVCNGLGVKPKSVSFIYNMIEIDAERQEKVKGRLVFASSPHKGLEQVLRLFADIRKTRPELILHVCNPGYLGLDAKELGEGVTYLGALKHSQVLEEISKAECLFYPQTVFAETFGIVLAEANAMGTPVLCHDMGAAAEVLGGTNEYSNEVGDCTDKTYVREALASILENLPEPRLDSRFHPDTVIAEWKRYLNA